MAQKEIVHFWKTLIHSMPRRIEACIDVQGGITKYRFYVEILTYLTFETRIHLALFYRLI